MLNPKLYDRSKYPKYLIPNIYNANWRVATTPLLRRADNYNMYSTTAPLHILEYAKMRAKQRSSQAQQLHMA
jgi:hypothetical protein